MKPEYPKNLYDGITDDPDSWGMCCSREAAEQCAREWYDRYHREELKYKIVAGTIAVLILSLIYILLI